MSRGTGAQGQCTRQSAREAGRWPGGGRAAGAHTGPGIRRRVGAGPNAGQDESVERVGI